MTQESGYELLLRVFQDLTYVFAFTLHSVLGGVKVHASQCTPLSCHASSFPRLTWSLRCHGVDGVHLE